jgi:hypothetical protein
MEIKIDTKRDSAEDIKKMIDFLQRFINESPDNAVPLADLPSGALNLFDTPPSQDNTPSKTIKKDASKDVPDIELY